MDREKVIRIIDELIFEAKKAPTWKAENALRCLKKELLKEQEAVVRCKDCKHRPKEPNLETYESGFDLEFPEGSKCPCRCSGDKWYSWYPEDDWFCADGERKPDDA